MSVGTITVSDFTLTLNNTARLTTTGLTVNSGGGLTTGSRTTVSGNITINTGGTWTAVGDTTVTGAVTNAGTMTLGGNTVSGITTLTNSGTITGSDNLRAATIVNSGTITGTTYGLDLTSAVTLTNSGTISGGTAAVRLSASGNTINIAPGAAFTNGIDYNNTTGNTTAFGTGSYTLAVKNYSVANNTVSVADASTKVLMTNDGNTVYAVDGSNSAKAVSNQTQEFGHSVSLVVSDMLTQVNSGGAGVDGGAAFTSAPPAALNYAGDGGPFDNTGNPLANPTFLPAQGVVVDGQGNTVWSRAFAGARYQPGSTSASATQAYYAGAVMGYDHRFEDWRIGGYAGYGWASQDSTNGSGDVKGNVYFGGLYGRREIGQWIVDLGMTGGSINNRSVRYVEGMAGVETAKADFDGFFIAPEAALSYAFRIDPAWTLTPEARLRYTGSFYGGYSESGSSQDITYGSQSVHILEERAELRLGHALKLNDGASFNSYVQAAAFDTQRVGSDVATASVLGTNVALNNETSRQLFGASLGAGFDWKIKKDVAIFAGADGLLYSNHSYGINSRAGFRISF